MGFPAEDFQRYYRNHIEEVAKFLEMKHKDKYKIYNLCSESKRHYDKSKFCDRVEEKFAFVDHNPPPFEMLRPFCHDVEEWLKRDRDNVAAIHCKAGKGRTGVMICAFLLHQGYFENPDSPGVRVQITSAEEALNFYGKQRTHDSKGVTIPSQRRYVYYYEELVKNKLCYYQKTIELKSIILDSLPSINGGNVVLICDIITLAPKVKLKTFEIEIKKGTKFLNYDIREPLFLTGDIKFEFYMKKMKKEKIFQFCFNTFFVKSQEYYIAKNNFNKGSTSPSSSSPSAYIRLPINGYSNGKVDNNQSSYPGTNHLGTQQLNRG